ncbi:hypothetical protein DVH24_016450 [Malus domestica]|uniref:WAT1-related protein n=1 Tax=Malus domestica TaxID=3750 RepID=A0A498HQ11_MALDO|nr:hypothetical protein DVH24_016450 [Malus domestica]
MLVMVLVQILSAVLNIIFKLVANDGMSLKVFTAYRVLFASVFMIPLALVLERNGRSKITWTILGQAFLCGLFGLSLAQNLFMESIAFASATYCVAITNLIPAITFLLAVCFRQEKLSLTSIPGMAKLAGTAVGLGGAMVFVFYKGITIKIWSVHVNLIDTKNKTTSSSSHHPTNYALGAVLAFLGFFEVCVHENKTQGKMTRTFPCPMSATALTSLMATIQSVIYALCAERDWKQWHLGWNIRLLGVVYSGILISGIAVTLMAWCINMRGPLYAASFFPVLLVLVAILASLLLEENLYLGSILGAVFIIGGLYLYLWGKSIEIKRMNRVEPLETPRPSEFQSIEIVTTSTSAPAITTGSNDNNITSNSSRG